MDCCGWTVISLMWEGRSSLPSFPQWGYSFSSFLILLGWYHSSFLCSYSVDVGQLKTKTKTLAHFGSSFTLGVLLQKMVLNRSINETSNCCYGWPWGDGLLSLILGERLQLEENQSTMVKMWWIFWQRPKLSGLLLSKKNLKMNGEQLSGIVHALHTTCFPQYYLKNGGRGAAIVIPMYYLESWASQKVD